MTLVSSKRDSAPVSACQRTNELREGLPKKSSCSFGFCPNYGTNWARHGRVFGLISAQILDILGIVAYLGHLFCISLARLVFKVFVKIVAIASPSVSSVSNLFQKSFVN